MSTAAIPRVFHRIWLDGPEPAEQFGWLESWRRYHPTWQIRTWTDENLPPLQNQRWFDRAASPAQRSDIARYELLARYGGVYLDGDMEALQPIDPLLGGVEFFAASEDDVWINIAILGCVPGNETMRRLVAALPASIAANSDAGVNVQTGPQFFTRIVNHARSAPQAIPVTVFPPALFYPYHFSEPHRSAGPFPGAYAVHHWAHNWGGI